MNQNEYLDTMLNSSVPLSFNQLELEAYFNTLKKYEGQRHSIVIDDLTKQLSAFTRVPFVVPLNSGTAAIHLALCALGVKSGDEVIVPTFTYVASVNPVLYLNAIPVFVDCESTTWNMDHAMLGQALENRTANKKKPKAIIVVHNYGFPCQFKEIKAIASKYKIPVIEDAAEAIGSYSNDAHLGSLGDIGILSFNNNKLLTSFGGGALLTSDQQIAEKVTYLAGQARETDLPFYQHMAVGFNYFMSPLCAAYALSQVEGLEQKIDGRRRVFSRYADSLSLIANWQRETVGIKTNRWLSAFAFQTSTDRDGFERKLNGSGIETRRLWKPMHRQPVFAGKFPEFLNGTADDLFSRGLCLPSGADLTEEEQERILEIITLM